ncbi:MAG: antibiotic biosynthesis monooxygenase [Burkholderiales bacterium]
MAGTLIRFYAALALSLSVLAVAPAFAQPVPLPVSTVTVVIEVILASKTAPAAAWTAMADMRAMLQQQPGYLAEEMLQNLNPANAPRYLHVSRWASIGYWAAVFRSPAFAKLNTHSREHYTVTVSAFTPSLEPPVPE